jgi:hypothetical protein
MRLIEKFKKWSLRERWIKFMLSMARQHHHINFLVS